MKLKQKNFKRSALSAICSLLICTNAFTYQTVVRDSSVDSIDESCSAGSTLTDASVVNTASDFFVIRTMAWDCGGVQQNSTSVTYNSIPMYKAVGWHRDATGGCFEDYATWYLPSPPIGTYSLVVTWDHSNCGMYATTNGFSKVRLQSPILVTDSGTVTCTGITRSVTPTMNGAFVVEQNNNGTNMTPTSGQTEDAKGAYKLNLKNESTALNWSLDSGCQGNVYTSVVFAPANDYGNPTVTMGSGGNVVVTQGSGGNVVVTHGK